MTQPTRRLNRRQFLKTIGVGAAFYAALPSRLLAGMTPQAGADETDLSFADENGFGPQLDAPYVEENFIPLHKEVYLPPVDAQSEEYQNALAILQSEFAYAKQAWSDDFRLVWSYQHYGVPDNSASCARLTEYCRSVQDFLYDTIHGLDELDITWQTLNPALDVANKKGTRALVGKYTYVVLRITGIDAEGNVQTPYLVNAEPAERAIHYIDAGDGDLQHPGSSLIYVICGATSLVAPFSEMLHMSTHRSAMRYAGELNKRLENDEALLQAHDSGETVTESAAVLMALDYLHRLGADERARQVLYHAKSLNESLPAFSHSLTYMKKHGVQHALDIYNESPEDYMKAIARLG